MIEGESIICFANDWATEPTSKTHIMRILSERNRVLWVNSIGIRRPSASGRDARRLATKLAQGLRGCMRIHDTLHVFSPLAVPLPDVPCVARLNAKILTLRLRHVAYRLGLDHPILWTFLPSVAHLVGRLGESMLIYHCVDEYTAFAGVRREALAAMERQLVGRADLVLTSSAQLCEERRPQNSRAFFVSHGVDVDHFAQALAPGLESPAEVRDLRRPVIGFFGYLAEWVDYDLVRHLALARPTWSFVLLGRANADLTPVRGLENVHLLGPKPYASLPAYCRGFDVGIIPFRRNALTVRANPLKLREYLAAGLPVVSTDLPEVRRYGDLVRTARTTEEFLSGIEAALQERIPALVQRRVETMKRESWRIRVDEISELIVACARAQSVGGRAPIQGPPFKGPLRVT